MINPDQSIPCPVCKTSILFDVKQLIMGIQFKCPNPACDASIGLVSESRTIVEETIKRLESVKGKISEK